MPRILRIIRSIPMPQVEYMDANIDSALDSLLLTSSKVGIGASASLVPDHILPQNWSEVRLDMTDGADTRAIMMTTKMRLHVDGLRVSVRRVGYYFRYNGLVGYSNEGSLDVGRRGKVGDGLSSDIDIETDTGSWHNLASDSDTLFAVSSVHATIPGLSVSIDQSKHMILNKLFIQPLASGLVGRTILWRAIEGQVRKGVQAILSRVIRGAERKAEERIIEVEIEEPEWGDYAEALLDEVMPNDDVTE